MRIELQRGRRDSRIYSMNNKGVCYCPASNDFDSGAFLRLFVYIHNDTEEAITCQHPNIVSII